MFLVQVWIEFGRINNLKCVDYYRVTYIKSDKTGVTTVTSDPVHRLEKGAQMTVVPCTLYTFRVAAYEEFHGTGRRFKMLSNEVNFTLDYTPKFIKDPIVWEKKASPLSNARLRQQPNREKRGIFKVWPNQNFFMPSSLFLENNNNRENDNRTLPDNSDSVGPYLH